MFFSKKETDKAAIEAFWAWFAENETWIKENIKGNGIAVIDAVDAKMKPVFPFVKRDLEFYMGYNNEVGEIFFNCRFSPSLRRGGNELGEAMPDSLKDTWRFVVER